MEPGSRNVTVTAIENNVAREYRVTLTVEAIGPGHEDEEAPEPSDIIQGFTDTSIRSAINRAFEDDFTGVTIDGLVPASD